MDLTDFHRQLAARMFEIVDRETADAICRVVRLRTRRFPRSEIVTPSTPGAGPSSLDQRRYLENEIARMFRVPNHMLSDGT